MVMAFNENSTAGDFSELFKLKNYFNVNFDWNR